MGEGDGIEAQDQQAHRNAARAIETSLLVDATADVGWLVPGQPVRLRLVLRAPVRLRLLVRAPVRLRLLLPVRPRVLLLERLVPLRLLEDAA